MTPTFAGEMQLAGWSESHTSGCKVTFWLSSPDDLEAFRALTVRKGNTAGHRFMAALVEIGDDERPIQPANIKNYPQKDIPEKPKGGELCRWAVLRCKEEDFFRFIRPVYRGYIGDVGPDDFDSKEDFCRHAVLVLSGCELSRSELDHDLKKAENFHKRVREPFIQWRATQ